jgi:multiple antibiotic resistance protein
MSHLGAAVNFFIALFALIDPVGTVPLFAAATVGATSAARRRIALYMAVFSALFLTFFYFTGMATLKFFGISMPAFRIAGGVILFLVGLDMSREDIPDADSEGGAETEALGAGAYARKHFQRLVVPFGMPLLIGPGAISTVIIYASQNADLGLAGTAAGVAAILAVSLTVLGSFSLTTVLSRVLGKVGMMIVVRVLGLILCAMAVQFIIIGLSGATNGLISGSAATPYPR